MSTDDQQEQPDLAAVLHGGTTVYALQSGVDAAGGAMGVPVVAIPDPDPGDP